MSKKFFLSFLLVFLVVIVSFFTIEQAAQEKPIVKKVSKVTKTYKYRKYLHVKQFYEGITKDAIEIGIKSYLSTQILKVE